MFITLPLEFRLIMFSVKTLLDKIHTSNNTHYGASLKTLQEEPNGTKPCEEKRVHHVLNSFNENINPHT